MRQTILLGAAVLTFCAAPVAAEPGKGHGNSANHSQHGAGHHPASPLGYGAGGCPPGLAKKNNGCLPPGQAKKLYNVGQRYPVQYGARYPYDRLPNDLRQRYGLSPSGTYYYGDGYYYQVDPKTMLIQQVISALIR